MSITVLFIFLAIILIVIGAIVVVVCLILKESKKSRDGRNVNMAPLEKENYQLVINSEAGSADRISDADMEYLKKMKNLKDKGILTEEEYNTERNKVLKE